ncbi:MAG: CaiB/BaiF CoA transferase family protein, partial [Dehalococcoidia bacterium]
RLISICDVVVENFSSRVMRSWGIGYDEMQKLRPDLVYVSMSGFGHTGRHHSYTTMGPSAQALSGLSYLSGLPGEPPAGWGWSYLDDTGGMYIALSALSALYHRNTTGQGQHVDLSQMMIGITLNGPALLDLTVNRRSTVREGYPPGNRAQWPGTPLVNNYRGPSVAPHNAYRTKGGGYNDWCVLTCHSDAEWQRLVQLMDAPQWAAVPKFASVLGRLEHQQELDQGIESWTLTLEKYELMERCQAAGVRAMPVQSTKDRVENDPQLRHRRLHTELEHPVLGSYKMQNAPFKLSNSPAAIHLPGPMIGQHNQEVLEGLLGLSHQEFVSGFEEGIFWPKTMDRYPYMEEMLQQGLDGRPTGNGLSQPQPTPSAGAGIDSRPGGVNVAETRVGASAGPLSGLRVLELCDEKGQFCGKLLADLGADVIKIEPPGGQSTRAVGPFLDDLPHRERSLSFWHYNASKRGVSLNLESAEGRELFRRLAATADVVLESLPPGYLPGLDLGYEQLRELNPKLIMCSLTPYGQTGPWADYATSDLLQLAAGGMMGCCGYEEADVPDAPPIAPGGGQAWHTGSHYAGIAILSALIFRARTGQGQYIDASVHDACALTTENHVPLYIYTGDVVRRQTGRHASPTPTLRTLYRCKDDKYVNIQIIAPTISPRQLKSLAEWMDRHGLAGDLLEESYQDPAFIQENISHINELVARFVPQLTRQEAFAGGQELGFPWGVVRTPDELLEDPHLGDRQFWVEVEHPELGRSFTYPGGAAIYGETPWRISRRAPLLGEHNEEIWRGELGLVPLKLSLLGEGGVI